MRRPSRRGVLLTAALVAAAALLAPSAAEEPGAGPPAGPPAARVSAGAVWPRVSRTELTIRLPGREQVRPVVVLPGLRAALAVAPTTDGTVDRLVLWHAGDRVEELRRRPASGGSAFTAFAADGDDIAWAETDDRGQVRLWAASSRDAAGARQVTDRTGDASFTGQPYELVIAGGRIHWTAAAVDGRTTEVRSVALAGGAVAVRRVDGLWALGPWPWLSDRRPGRAGTSRLMNLSNGQEMRAVSPVDGVATCGPVWCQVWVLRRGGPARLDLMRPDGSDRHTIDDSGADSAGEDVAVLDRFVVLTVPEPNAPVVGSVTVLVHDIRTRQTVVVAAGVSTVYSHGTVLWWSTADEATARWTALDLRKV